MCGQSPPAFFHAGIDVRPVTPWIFSCWLLPDSALLCQWNHSKTTHLNFEQYTKVHASLARNLQKTIQLHASDVWRKPEHNIYYHGMPLNYTIRHRKTSIFHSLNFEKKHNPSSWTKWIKPTATWLASKEPIILTHFRSSKQIKVGIKTPTKSSNTEWFRANLNLPTTEQLMRIVRFETISLACKTHISSEN